MKMWQMKSIIAFFQHQFWRFFFMAISMGKLIFTVRYFSDDCRYTTGRECRNGACLNSQCHCNDGYGGKGCDMPDDNECKYRPCDVFAYCTNTLGSYFCSCREGYSGDGHQCTDIDECKNPALAARCVQNAECCNLPAHFVCKCQAGFEGDGEVECRGKKTYFLIQKTRIDEIKTNGKEKRSSASIIMNNEY